MAGNRAARRWRPGCRHGAEATPSALTEFRWQRRHNGVLRTGSVSSPRLQPLISAIDQVLLLSGKTN
jgi:hypothetical protein